MHELGPVIALLGIIIFAAHFFEVIFKQTKIPDVLPLVIIGLILGPLLNIASPTYFGAVGPVFTIITFIFILFEAGTGLSIESIRKSFKDTLLITLLSFLFTVIIVGAAAVYLTGLGILRSLLLATIVGGTSSAIVAPILQQLKIGDESKSILVLESSATDVIVVICAISVMEIVKVGDPGQIDIGLIIGKIIASFLLATMIGMISAIVWSYLLKWVRGLQNSIFITAACVFVVYGLTEWLGYSGAVSALAFGITMGNVGLLKILPLTSQVKVRASELNLTEKTFFSEMVFILKTFFFVYIGISLQLAQWNLIIVGLILTIIIYLIRLPIVRLTLQKSIPALDAAMISVIIPRGLAAAVLASMPFQQGISGGDAIQNIAYTIILVSIVFTSLLVFLIDKTKLSRFYFRIFSKFGNAV